MAYGKIKADTFVYDNSGSDVEVTLSSLGNKAPLASPTFTGTVTIPTPAANDNTTKAASTAYVQTELGDYLTTALGAPKASPALTGTATAVNLTLSGDLTVNGTTTTINSTTLAVDDKNIELGTVDTPSDTTADGGGITLKGATDKTFNWINSIDAWESNQHIHIGDNLKLDIGTGSDLQIWHSGTHSHIRNGTGELKLEVKSDGQAAVKCVADGAVSLYHSGSLKLATSAAGVTVSGTVTDSKGDVRKIPQQDEQGAAHTLVAADAAKHLYVNATVTIPNSVFSTGDAITLINTSGSDITLTQGSGVTLHNSADATTGNRTLGSRGMATVLFVTSSTAYISGAGLS